jgi:hypothetical protein
MTRTITRSYDGREDAETAVGRLEAAGVASEEISLISHRPGTLEQDATEGAEIGGAVGGGAGLLAGLAALSVPGIGPVLAAGWLLGSTAVGAAAGAAAGSLIGALTGTGLSDEDAHYYAETVRRGGAIVSVRTVDSHAAVIEKILDRAGPIDAAARRAEYERDGWTHFDERGGAYRSPSDLSGVVS